MSIKLYCAGCDKTYTVKDEMAGRRAKCPQGHELIVPKLEEAVAVAPGPPQKSEAPAAESVAFPKLKKAAKQAAPIVSTVQVANKFAANTKQFAVPQVSGMLWAQIACHFVLNQMVGGAHLYLGFVYKRFDLLSVAFGCIVFNILMSWAIARVDLLRKRGAAAIAIAALFVAWSFLSAFLFPLKVEGAQEEKALPYLLLTRMLAAFYFSHALILGSRIWFCNIRRLTPDEFLEFRGLDEARRDIRRSLAIPAITLQVFGTFIVLGPFLPNFIAGGLALIVGGQLVRDMRGFKAARIWLIVGLVLTLPNPLTLLLVIWLLVMISKSEVKTAFTGAAPAS